MAQKVKSKTLLKKGKVSRKRRYSSSSDEWDSNSGRDSSEDSDSGEDSEKSSEEEMPQDDHYLRFSTKSSAVKRINRNLINNLKNEQKFKERTKDKNLKQIPDQEIKDSILNMNPVPSTFLSWQKFNGY